MIQDLGLTCWKPLPTSLSCHTTGSEVLVVNCPGLTRLYCKLAEVCGPSSAKRDEVARACSSFILSFLPGRPRNHTPEALDRLNPHSTRPPRIWHSVGECSFALGCLLQSLWPWFRAWGLRVCGLECTIEAGILTNITPHSSGLFFTNQKARDILIFIVPPRHTELVELRRD